MSFIKEKLPRRSGRKKLAEGKQNHLDKSNNSVSSTKGCIFFFVFSRLYWPDLHNVYLSCNLQIFIKPKAHSNINHRSPFFTKIKVRRKDYTMQIPIMPQWTECSPHLRKYLKAGAKPTEPVKVGRRKGLEERAGGWL